MSDDVLTHITRSYIILLIVLCFKWMVALCYAY